MLLLQVTVAVKTLYGKDEVHSTFIKEAQSMRALLHQHIIQLYGIVLSSPLMLVTALCIYCSQLPTHAGNCFIYILFSAPHSCW